MKKARIPHSESFEKYPLFVIPAKAGIQKVLKGLDSCFRRNDDLPSFGRNSKLSTFDFHGSLEI